MPTLCCPYCSAIWHCQPSLPIAEWRAKYFSDQAGVQVPRYDCAACAGAKYRGWYFRIDENGNRVDCSSDALGARPDNQRWYEAQKKIKIK